MEDFNGLDLIDNETLAKMLFMSPQTLNVWRSQGRIPYVKLAGGTKVVYRKSDILDWLEKADKKAVK